MDDREFDTWLMSATPRLRGAAYLLAGSVEAADDLLQDTLVRVYQRRERIEAGACTAYARRVLATRAVDAGRRPWRREVPVAAVPDRAATLHDEVGIDVVGALAALPAGQRAVLVMRFFEDLDVDSTAATLGVSTGTVKSQTSRGLERLRELMSTPITVGTGEEMT
jgi:RNA polymerase sigma-70 factor (sigma-E family)